MYAGCGVADSKGLGGVVVTESERQSIVDQEHLKLLPIGFWVLGALDIFIAMYGVIYIGFGVLFANAPLSTPGSAAVVPPAFFAWFFVAMGAAFMVAFGALATLKILSGFWIRKRTHRTACLVIAGISCASIPFGTIVGVLAFMVLLRPSVSALFGVAPAQPLALMDGVA